MAKLDSLKVKTQLDVEGKKYNIFDLNKASEALGVELKKLPYSIRVLFENLLRSEDGEAVTLEDIKAIKDWSVNKSSAQEISFHPARVLMQDFTGVPAIVDLAAMRDASNNLGGDPKKVNPLIPVDLVIDHSVQVDYSGEPLALQKNTDIEMARNNERYRFLKWGQAAFTNFKVVPPGTGICHQVNLEFIGKVVWQNEEDGELYAYPDSLVGTDSHTTMINGLAVLGWGVGGIEAEAAMLGQPISMLIPEVIGFKMTGTLNEGVTATDLVLNVTQMLRKKGVVGKFVEFYGSGLDNLGLSDRATISNMAPEYGATCGFFPIDQETIRYLKLTGRDDAVIALVEKYAKAQNLWRSSQDPEFTDTLELDLSSIKPCIAGPKRPQDKVLLEDAPSSFQKEIPTLTKATNSLEKYSTVENHDFKLAHGDIVIAALTSCTNTSNPSVMIAAGLVAKKANALGVTIPKWVKTSLAPGSQVVSEYFDISGLQTELDKLGFQTVGYGCATCIGNSGPLNVDIANAIAKDDVIATSVLSGNRNFEGRVHPSVKANYLASPPLVIAYAIAGNINVDIANGVIAKGANGKDVYLKDIWPTNAEIWDVMTTYITSAIFKKRYASVFTGDKAWQDIHIEKTLTYGWNKDNTYINNPPYFHEMQHQPKARTDIENANILAIFGDSITTDHISPAGDIAKEGPSAHYLESRGVNRNDFNSYGARRGNHEVMIRGTFANIRIKNEIVKGVEGGFTKYFDKNSTPSDKMPIFDAATKYQETQTPLIIFAGKEYGTGSSRDWAAKGTRLLGVKAVIAESFERIHRSNLIGMGVLPLVFMPGENRQTLKLEGNETISIHGLNNLSPKMTIDCKIKRANGETLTLKLKCCIDTYGELTYFNNDGILPYVLRNLTK